MTDSEPSTPSRVLLVDDHEIVRQGLRSILEERPELTIVGEAATVAEAIERARELTPDTIVMDLRLPDGDGVEACREIRAERPETRVLILTSHADQQALVSAVLAGAAGFLLKTLDAAKTQNAVVAVSRGESLLDAAHVAELVERFTTAHPDPTDDQISTLTRRESRILNLIADGLTNNEIANQLDLSPKTVKNYVSAIYSKVEVRNRAEAARLVAERRARDTEG
jgi:DNA-binding NarL/FixJ family response regulator